ncbi:aldo/keto reductase [Sutterella sp.]|uniref:aldo/keto reductase n=1 Tax=Sutterella sp. TaxID=1981025 RepID=UPI0026DF26BC|nr:aldo/keto reductase [Sutterella sp.]MDO5532618.1 aldo/keto reductase [Sutterella sp.]
MQYRHLGRTGLLVSPLALGTMNFGDRTDESTAHAILSAAADAGINLVDTADVYGTPQTPDIKQGSGRSEEIIGSWLKSTGRRDEIVLATKLYQPMGPGPNDRRLSARHIRAACEASLRRLGTDRIDLYQMHHMDRFTPVDEILEAMGRLVADGKVLYFGSSNFAGWYIAAMQSEALSRHMLGLVSEQSIYSLVDRAVELEVIPACRHFGIGLLAWSPLGRGLLAGVLHAHDCGRRTLPALRARVERHRAQLEQWEALCAELGLPPSEVALAWLLGRPGLTAAVTGPRTMAHLEGSLRALDLELPPEVIARIEAIWPGPGGEAPEAYAW